MGGADGEQKIERERDEMDETDQREKRKFRVRET